MARAITAAAGIPTCMERFNLLFVQRSKELGQVLLAGDGFDNLVDAFGAFFVKVTED